MNLFAHFRGCLGSALERKKTLVFVAAVYVLFFIVGACCARSPAMFEYNRNLCARYIDRVCYSDTDVFVLFFTRLLGHGLLFVLVLAGSIHPAAMLFPAAVLLYRSFTFGGSVVLFFAVYGAAGALVVFILYLPIHLLIDVSLLLACSRSCGRCTSFCFCGDDLLVLLLDLLCFVLVAVAVGAVEGLLLAALYHPLGNIL